ncbi:hypothetical protein ACOMHN_052563 [Nucella lapillus]
MGGMLLTHDRQTDFSCGLSGDSRGMVRSAMRNKVSSATCYATGRVYAPSPPGLDNRLVLPQLLPITSPGGGVVDFTQQTSGSKRADLRVVLWKKVTSATAKEKSRLHMLSLTQHISPSSRGRQPEYLSGAMDEGSANEWNWPGKYH